MFLSRRSREIIPNTNRNVSEMSEKARFQQQAMTSAKYILQDFLAKFTHDRIPQGLQDGLNAIQNAKTLNDLLAIQMSPYKLIRDAVQDEIRVMQGLSPNSATSVMYSGRDLDLNANTMSIFCSTVRQTELHPVNESFRLQDHDLTNKRGSVHETYQSFTHDLNQPIDGGDGVVKQASPY